MSKLPYVNLIVAGTQELTEQTYEKLRTFQNTENKPPAVFYNQFKDELDDGFWFYLSAYDDFGEHSAIEKIVDKLMYHESVGGAYCDSVIAVEGSGVKPQILPAFHPNLMNSQLIFNTPLFFKYPQTFDEDYQHLCFYQLWKSVVHKTLFMHVPHPLIITRLYNNDEIVKELQKIKEHAT